MVRRHVIGIALLATFAIGAWALAQPQQLVGKGPTSDRLVRSVYSVADLIEADEILTNRLIEIIKQGMGPKTWSDAGGRGTLQYFPMGKALVVNQTEEVHQRVSLLLNSFRKSRIPWWQLQ